MINRRAFGRTMALGGLAAGLLPEWARSANAPGLSATRSTPKSRYDIIIGQKATTVVNTAKMTGRPTSRAPSTAEASGGSPSSCLR